jgi:hypothetical protein
MKKLLLLGTAMVFALPFASAKADLILVQETATGPIPATGPNAIVESFTDLGAQGFGHAPRMLTLQEPASTAVETGGDTPTGLTGDAVPGADKESTPTLAALGWTSGSRVGIGFNLSQTGHSGITMQSLTLSIYNGTTLVDSFSLAGCPTNAPSCAPLTFTGADDALQTGNGNSVFNFGLNAAEQATFNNILAMTGSSGFTADLASSLGCPTGAPAGCLPANDGPESFVGFAQAVPGPIVGAGLPGLVAAACLGMIALARRRINWLRGAA